MSATKKHEPAWTVANAKAHLSEVIERAQSEPQMITRNGTPSVVMVSVEEWNRKTVRKGSLATFLLSSPLSGADLADARLLDEPRDLAL
jgi:prevent-host-death family protein